MFVGFSHLNSDSHCLKFHFTDFSQLKACHGMQGIQQCLIPLAWHSAVKPTKTGLWVCLKLIPPIPMEHYHCPNCPHSNWFTFGYYPISLSNIIIQYLISLISFDLHYWKIVYPVLSNYHYPSYRYPDCPHLYYPYCTETEVGPTTTNHTATGGTKKSKLIRILQPGVLYLSRAV